MFRDLVSRIEMPAWQSRLFTVAGLALSIFVLAGPADIDTARATDLETASSLGAGNGVLVLGPENEGGCELLMNSDGSYENGYCWRYGGVAEPYYGAFAEQYFGEVEVCSAIFDFSQTGNQVGQVMDVYVWDDDGGIPGAVLCVEQDVLPDEIAFWPSVSRHTVPFSSTCETPDTWWVGYWGQWPDGTCAWFIGADTDGFGGNPMTNINPGIGFPSGWNNVSVAWGPTQALGIGAEITDPPPPPVWTLQELIDDADPGAVVDVPPGIYSGIGNKRLDFNGKDITLRATGGPGVTTIRCENNGRGFHFESGETRDAVVEGFTIEGGLVSGDAGFGGAVKCENGSSPTFRDCVFRSCRAGSGGGIAVIDSSPLFQSCTIEDCIATTATQVARGGGVYTENSSAEFVDCRILGNQAEEHGGVSSSGSSDSFSSCWVRGNSAQDGVGGGIYLGPGSTSDFGGCLITGNFSVGDGGGVHAAAGSDGMIRNSTIAGNRVWPESVNGNGGGVAVFGDLSVSRTIIWGNCAKDAGDAIFADASSNATLLCSAIDPGSVSGSVHYLGSQLYSDPLMCGAVSCESAPTTAGNYHVNESSGCLPANSNCGELIGALWIRCPFPQLPDGACCLNTGECFLTAEVLCEPYGGAFSGAGTVCDPSPCNVTDVPSDPVTSVSALTITSPNPTTGALRYSISLASSDQVRVGLYDVTGKLVQTVLDQDLAEGLHDFGVSLSRQDGAELAGGVYYLRMNTGRGVASEKVVLAR